MRTAEEAGGGCPGCGAPAAPRARFCTECGHRLEASGPGPRRELRPMTALFCGIPDTTAHTLRPDGVEEQGERLAALLHVVTRVAERHGAGLVRFLGDGVLVQFGWPAAQEDDTPRAAAAALAIRDAVAAEIRVGGAPLRIRAGLAAGLVMVTDPAGTGDPRQLTILGEALNLAARLEAMAPAGVVLVSASVAAQLAGRFALHARGQQRIRGWAEPVPVAELLAPLAEGEAEEAGAAACGAARAPLLGRDAPLAGLRRLWQAALDGRGGAALILGEAGIGKSRLVGQLLAEVPRERQLRLFAAPQEQGMPLQPLVRWLGRAAALLPEDPVAQRRRKLEKLLAIVPDQHLPPILGLMGAEEAVAGGAEMPQRRRARLLDALLEALVAVAMRQPLLVVFEDLHWADPTTLDLLGSLAVRIADLPVLFLATARPVPLPDWAQAEALPRFALRPLEEAEAAVLVRAVAQDVPLPPATLRDLLQRAEGVPLFLEELTRAVVEDLAQAASGAAAAGEGAGRRAAVPASLQASLLARLERVGGARAVAEAAAVIGREFEPELLADVLEEPLPALGVRLDRLAETGLLQRQGADRFRFRHALLQGAAIGLLPRDRLRDLHARVAERLEAAQGRATPQRVAHHWTEAGRVTEALAWWRRGAEQAMARSAPAEALSQLRRALALLREQPETEARLRDELDLEFRAGDALLVLHGHGAAETGATYDRARALSERLPGRPALRAAMHGQWSHAFMRGRIVDSLDRAEALLRVAEEAGHPAGLVIGHSAMAHSQVLLGRFRAAAESAARSLAQHDPADRAGRHDMALQVMLISTRCYFAFARMFLGRAQELRQELAMTLAAAERSGVPFAIANAGYALGFHDAWHGAEAAALDRLVVTAAYAQEQAIGFIGLTAAALAAQLAGRAGDPGRGLVAVRRAIAGAEATGLLVLQPHFLGIEAELVALAGDVAAGLARQEAAEAAMRASGALWEEAPMLCRRAEMLLALDRRAEAVAALRRARAVAQGQGAGLFALRAAAALAPLLDAEDDGGEARAMLAEALRPFAGLEEPVVQRARALLAALGGAAPGDADPVAGGA